MASKLPLSSASAIRAARGPRRRTHAAQTVVAAGTGDGLAVLGAGGGAAPGSAPRSREQAQDVPASYFRDLADLPRLTPETEQLLARRIAVLEEVLWVHLLTFAPLTSHIIAAVEQAAGSELSELRALAATASELLTHEQQTGLALNEAATAAAVRLRARDPERTLVDAALHAARTLAQTAWEPAGTASGNHAQPWRSFTRGAELLSRLVQREKSDFVIANLCLVVCIARRFNYGRMPLSDLIQEGNLGLMRAVERFDYRRGVRFASYAAWWIRHAITRSLAQKGRVVKLPVHLLAAMRHVYKAKRRLEGELGRTPSPEELADAAKQPMDKLAVLDSALVADALSLDRAVTQGEGESFAQRLEDETALAGISERLMHQEHLITVRSLMDRLTPLERDILRLRFGLDCDGDEELTLTEIGKRHSLCRERIRQIQEKVLTRMRKALLRSEEAELSRGRTGREL